jgi:15-cis-phytoene synthase
MKHDVSTIEQSHRFCHAFARRARSNFYPCFVVLPKAQRRAMEAIYAFMRHTDDLGDRPTAGSAVSALDALRVWRVALDRALTHTLGATAGLPSSVGSTVGQANRGTQRVTPLPHGRGSDLSDPDVAAMILPAVADVVRRFNVPSEHLHAVIDGVEMDVEPRGYETFDELAEYCHRVASAVGLACIHVWGFHGDGAIEAARRCGLAVQLTNILRDLKEDAAMGRVYLPREDFRQCGYSAEALARGEPGEAFERLMKMEIARAEAFYREGEALFDYLEPPGRRILGLMLGVYRRLLRKIQREPPVVLSRRVRLGRLERLLLAARWLLLPSGRRTRS